MKTYREIGVQEGLLGRTLERYVEYMLARWKDTEELECQTGYAAQWAKRFRGGNEYGSSDLEGQGVLKNIDAR